MDASIRPPPACADECWFEWRIQPYCVRFCIPVRSQVCVCVWVSENVNVCVLVCAATSGPPDAPWWQKRRVRHPAAPLLWDNGGCITHFTHYRSLSLSFSFTRTHAPFTTLFPLTHTHIHTYKPVSFPSLSLRGFTHHLIGLNQLWQCWPRSHTPCLGGRPHYETITPLIDS